jgi:siroheme synthase-like protein
VVAPAVSAAIRARATVAPIAIIERGFLAGDLDGARWVVAAATPDINRAVAAAAHERGLFVNAVDDVASASAYLGAVVRRGPVLLAISTGGIAPALAGLLREALEAVLPDDLARWIDVATAARADWKRAGTPIGERRPLLLRALDRIYGRSDVPVHGHTDAPVHGHIDAPIDDASIHGRIPDDVHADIHTGALS